MTVDVYDRALKGKTDRGQWRVLALMAAYLVLAVAVGAARSQLHDAHPAGAAQAALSDAGADHGASRRFN